MNNEGTIRFEDKNINKLNPKKSAKKNYLYNLIYQFFLLIVPLVVTPYVSRVLTSEGIGQYSFSFSLITYFTIIASLGFGYYAQREIAKHQDDKSAQSISFWEIILCRLVPVSIALFINILFCVLKIYGDYNILMWIFNINILAVAFDITFLYQGNEEFGKLVVRNLLIKTLSIIAIFVLVKDKNDLWKYAIINSLSIFLSSVIMWALVKKYICKIKVSSLKPLKHLKGTIVLFLPTIAVSIYTILDKTLIGALVVGETLTTLEDGSTVIIKNSDIQNGYYEQSEKIVKMALTILTSLGAVMVPKNAYCFNNGDIERVKENIYKALLFVLFLGMPIMFGLMAVASNFSPWFFGDGYDDVPYIIMILSPLILAIGLNNVFGIQYLVPTGKDKAYTISVIFGAITNLLLNILLIRQFMARGAAIASVIAETSILVFQIIYLRKEFNLKKLILPFIKYFFFGIIMFVIVYIISIRLLYPSVLNTFFLVIIGISVYFLLLLISRDKILFAIFSKIKKIARKKNELH